MHQHRGLGQFLPACLSNTRGNLSVELKNLLVASSLDDSLDFQVGLIHRSCDGQAAAPEIIPLNFVCTSFHSCFWKRRA